MTLQANARIPGSLVSFSKYTNSKNHKNISSKISIHNSQAINTKTPNLYTALPKGPASTPVCSHFAASIYTHIPPYHAQINSPNPNLLQYKPPSSHSNSKNSSLPWVA